MLFADEPCSKEWPFSSCLAIVSIVHRSPCLFKQSLSRMGQERPQMMECKWPSQRCCLNALDCHFWPFVEHHCERHALLRAHNVRRRLILRFLPLPHPRSMQLMLKATILAILHPPSVFPRQKATKSQKSKKNAAQPRLEPEKCSKNRPQKKVGPETRQPPKIHISISRLDLTLRLLLSVQALKVDKTEQLRKGRTGFLQS